MCFILHRRMQLSSIDKHYSNFLRISPFLPWSQILSCNLREFFLICHMHRRCAQSENNSSMTPAKAKSRSVTRTWSLYRRISQLLKRSVIICLLCNLRAELTGRVSVYFFFFFALKIGKQRNRPGALQTYAVQDYGTIMRA